MTITADWILGIIAALCIGGIIGLVKHVITDEATRTKLDDLKESVAALRKIVDAGVLPRTDERIHSLEQRLVKIEKREDGENR